MTGKRNCTVYVGNLDERVTDKVLYEILIQAGRVVELHIPQDKESNRHKGFAFAEYESEEIADYAVRLFSGLVTLYNRTLKFGISGQDKSSSTHNTPVANMGLNSLPKPRPPHFTQDLSPLAIAQPNGYGSNFTGNSIDYNRRAYGAPSNNPTHSNSSHRSRDLRNPINYPSY